VVLRALYFVAVLSGLLLAAPNAPSDLWFDQITKNSVTLHWRDNSDDESGFKIYRDGELIYIAKENATSFKDTFLYHNREYLYEIKATDDPILDVDMKRRFRVIKSAFENSDTNLQYWYAENINDGRGVTAGISGFTTGTWDLGELLRRYENVRPDNRLSKFRYIVDKRELSEDEERELILAWGEEANSSKEFRDVQDKMDDELYFYPAMDQSYKRGFIYPVTMFEVYDAYIQHGLESEVLDGVKIKGVNDLFKESDEIYDGGDEIEYLKVFLNVREETLDSTSGWEDTSYRVKAVRDIVDNDNIYLKPVIHLKLRYDNGSVDEFDID
jgi:chitosanase